MTSETRADDVETTSTACLMTGITSSHSPSMFVNMAWVSLGKPDSRTTRIASATAADTLPESSDAAGLMLKATSMPPASHYCWWSGAVEDAQGLSAAGDDHHVVTLVHRRDADKAGARADLRRRVNGVDTRELVRAGDRDTRRRDRRHRAALQVHRAVTVLHPQRELPVFEPGQH